MRLAIVDALAITKREQRDRDVLMKLITYSETPRDGLLKMQQELVLIEGWSLMRGTVFIQIDAHAKIDAHLPLSASSWLTEMGKIGDVLSKRHESMMKRPYICNYSILL